ncbi:peptidase U61 [Bacteroidales bacterium]|nr:peptidase U61 [Bacteroidales bacterium]
MLPTQKLTLNKGDLLAIVSPSGAMDAEYILDAKKNFEQWGFNVVIGENALAQHGRFAGTDNKRLHDLQWALDDDKIKAIVCSRGGYGAVQLLEKISMEGFLKSPKWIVGFSDITFLHSLILKNGIPSLHAPMCRQIAETGKDKSSVYLKKILLGKPLKYEMKTHKMSREGQARGSLMGGNLSVLIALRGTKYDSLKNDTEGGKIILFIEDVAEKIYHIERMLYNLKLGGVLSQLAGLIVGQFLDCEEDILMPKDIKNTILNMVEEYNYPVCFDFPAGHGLKNYPLILGADIYIDIKKDITTLQQY